MQDMRKTNCHLCGYFCGLKVGVDADGNVTRIAPDPDRYPYDPAVLGQCRRVGANKEILNHPQRVNYALRRVGERGSGNWRRVSWNEALDDIAVRLKKSKRQYGAESLATCISAPHTMYWPMHRFLNLWGTPNNVGIGIVCWNPRVWVGSITYGWPIEDELVPAATRCAILWGINPADSDRSLFWKSLPEFARTGKLIVIDPRRTKTARLANEWICIRPGTDGALAVGMLKVIIEQGLWDHDFVERWCSGFDQLVERVNDYSLPKLAEKAGVPVAVIESVARLYATHKPASIFTGLGIDMSGRSCTQTLRAIAALRAITGNIDVPGASFLHDPPDFMAEVDLELSDVLPPWQRAKKLGSELFKLTSYGGYERLSEFTKVHGKRLPMRYLTSAHPDLVWHAIVTGKPYPVRALIAMASNPLSSQANTKQVHAALKSLDLLVVLEQFLTPTAMLADYVLPAAGSFEQPLLQLNGGIANVAYGGPAAIPPRYERRTDFDFWCDLGKRCGQAEYWPWSKIEDALDYVLKPAGTSWEEFCHSGVYAGVREYNKYEKVGFATPSGKVELYSTLLEEFGHDPLPRYIELEDNATAYPLRLITGARKHPYYSSEFRQIDTIRKQHTHPAAEISAATASQLGVEDGDSVWIETPQGRIKQTLAVTEMQDDVVSVEYGWWFPEQRSSNPVLGGVWESNANVLTSADTATCDPILGQWSFRSIPCNLYKVVEPEITIAKATSEDLPELESLLAENGMAYADPLELFVVARKDNELVGCIRVEDYPDLALVRPVVIKKAYRRLGIGQALLNHIPSKKPTALVARGETVRFYETCGFGTADWNMMPPHQCDECAACEDRAQCRPQPMKLDPASRSIVRENSREMTLP
jgi:thiosulfate reductase/polysulfide reductase chain A